MPSPSSTARSARPKAVPKRRDDIIDIIPCFFDLQVQTVLKLLNISSHTLKRIRQELRLDRWPFEKISHGRSVVWGGETMGWEEIQQFRARTIPHVNDEMQEILRACDRKGVLMRALYLPGYARRMRGTILREHEAAQIQAFREAIPVTMPAGPEEPVDEEKAIPAKVLSPTPHAPEQERPAEPFAFGEEDRALLEEVGLLEFAEIRGGGHAHALPQLEGEDWAGMQEDEYWAEVSRHLFESEGV